MYKNFRLLIIAIVSLAGSIVAADLVVTIEDRDGFFGDTQSSRNAPSVIIRGQQIDQEFAEQLKSLNSYPELRSLTFSHCTFNPLLTLAMYDFSYLCALKLTNFSIRNCGLTVAMADEVCRSLEDTVRSIDFSNDASGSNPNAIDTTTTEYRTLLGLYFNGNKFPVEAPSL